MCTHEQAHHREKGGLVDELDSAAGGSSLRAEEGATSS